MANQQIDNIEDINEAINPITPPINGQEGLEILGHNRNQSVILSRFSRSFFKVYSHLIALYSSIKTLNSGKEDKFDKNSGFNREKTDLVENDTNKIFSAKGAFDLKNWLVTNYTTLMNNIRESLTTLIGTRLPHGGYSGTGLDLYNTKMNGRSNLGSEVIDLNNLTTDGMYYGYKWENSPSSTIAVVDVKKYSGHWIVQRFWDIEKCKAHTRFFKGGTTWSDWIYDFTTNNKPTKFDVGLENVDNTSDSTKSVRTATRLATPRTINGTDFDGSKEIITASWGSSRTFTIGKQARTVNGSGNVNWTLNEIGAIDKAGDTAQNLGYSPYRLVIPKVLSQVEPTGQTTHNTIAVRLRSGFSNTMISFDLKVRSYQKRDSNTTISFNGYAYSPNSGSWQASSAYVFGFSNIPVKIYTTKHASGDPLIYFHFPSGFDYMNCGIFNVLCGTNVEFDIYTIEGSAGDLVPTNYAYSTRDLDNARIGVVPYEYVAINATTWYKKYMDGVLEMSIRAVIGSNENNTITFPISFVDANFNIGSTQFNTVADGKISIVSQRNNGITVHRGETGVSTTYMQMVILGRWK